MLCHQVAGIHRHPYLGPSGCCQPHHLKSPRFLLFASLSGRAEIIQTILLKKKTKITLAPPISLLTGRTKSLSSASKVRVRNRICLGDGTPIAFLAEVGIWLGPLQCFQGKVSTIVTVPGSRPARDFGLHSPLASHPCDAPEAGPHQLFAGCPERAYFGNNTARCRVASTRACPPPASCRRRPCPRLPPPAAAGWAFPPPSQLSLGAKPPSARHAGPWHGTLASRLGGRDSPLEPPRTHSYHIVEPVCCVEQAAGEMEPPQCVEELEDDVFQPEDGEPGAQPRRLLSADLFAQSQLDCPLSRLQLFPLTHCCGPGLRPTSQEDKATQTLSPASPSQGVMLPCGVTEEPQRLFYGNAGYRLPLPASFPAGLPLGEQPPEGQWQHRAEIQIARKLQCIADQFHRLHMQQHQQNRNRMWWQILLFLHNVALNGDENRNGAGPR